MTPVGRRLHSGIGALLTARMVTIVCALPPKRGGRRKRRAAALNVVVDHNVKRAPFDVGEHRRRGDAADALWRELVRRVEQR
jgi:hypothetical protein